MLLDNGLRLVLDRFAAPTAAAAVRVGVGSLFEGRGVRQEGEPPVRQKESRALPADSRQAAGQGDLGDAVLHDRNPDLVRAKAEKYGIDIVAPEDL
ncbi:conserved hypothetical protein, fragment [Thermoproteus tenax Kra 1]|uniref:Uncharacterized protein n=1 Tax=Thermoproteus tenax (strain ATCC 35583 / DSM 2078 / JCM 9277 / NBRC 100435 / Kra 1) TaxID=768679 RepID=G4RNA5_THETK|nr:conserved hypothetical protein, fragment [Thermoproteus tenax Kra 1]